MELTDEQRQAVCDAVAEALGDAYDCLRVWRAWGYGTMSADDFSLVAEDDSRVAEIADAAIGAIEAAASAPVIADTAGEVSAQDIDAAKRCLPVFEQRFKELTGKDFSDTAGTKPQGWKLVRVNEHFDALIAALERAENKGYLPDAMAEEWANFACDENTASPAIDAAGASNEPNRWQKAQMAFGGGESAAHLPDNIDWTRVMALAEEHGDGWSEEKGWSFHCDDDLFNFAGELAKESGK
ncbi:hypothetical protein AWB78_01298 [Caballeronia calidae]|uniref:Uncharacterized protein n=1 Tax=Caballeronia calidae TaxID=1777139 RepID=A0A158A5M6_9BURK|nr:hypothetical protein [Caballeronia calidae]SAK53154.1 hypothetical protein AWB78_01298 [Caballeronia calidae]